MSLELVYIVVVPVALLLLVVFFIYIGAEINNANEGTALVLATSCAAVAWPILLILMPIYGVLFLMGVGVKKLYDYVHKGEQ